MKTSEDLIFYITIEQVQDEAQRILGRQLASNELSDAKDQIENGISTSIDTIFEAAITEVARIYSENK